MANRKDSSGKSVYGNKWRVARGGFLKKHPYCSFCHANAIVVDHIIPHRGDMKLFWDKTNWQSLCKKCHDQVKKLDENSTVPRGVCSDGTPLNSDSEWYK